MQLSPYTTAFFAVFFDFPFAFTKDLQPGGINHQMRDFTPGERFETDINRLCALTDTGVIRAKFDLFNKASLSTSMWVHYTDLDRISLYQITALFC